MVIEMYKEIEGNAFNTDDAHNLLNATAATRGENLN